MRIGEVALSTTRESSVDVTGEILPVPPTEAEKYSYIERSLGLLVLSSVLGGAGVSLALLRLALSSPWLWLLLLPLVFTIPHRLAWFWIVPRGRGFALRPHQLLVESWRPLQYPSVDVFLPVCGEDLRVLRNTWHYVSRLDYPGRIHIYCLDDGANAEVEALAEEYGISYMSRPNRGWFKKAGNLRYGYERTDGEFLVVFDADFCPRPDFLVELLPYFESEPKLGIVQSPQYFHMRSDQNWLERGAGAVQGSFYRIMQTSRQWHGGAICVGTNAVYRRSALEAVGGNSLVEYSEDVHTGFDLRRHGWDLRYVPIVLATGLCPDRLSPFFSQQYRWCRGSMGLSVSRKFWSTKLSLSSRLCFASGFLFYLHHVAISIVAPAMLVVLIYLSPDSFDTIGYGLVAPWLLLSLVVLPLWHRPTYRFDILTVRLISSWAYLFAAVDLMRGRSMAWQATGAKSQSDWRFKMAKLGVLVWNGGCGFVLMGLSIWSTLHSQTAGFGPIFLLGLTYCVMAGRIVKLSTQIPQATANLVIPLPREEMMPVAITPEQNLEVA